MKIFSDGNQIMKKLDEVKKHVLSKLFAKKLQSYECYA